MAKLQEKAAECGCEDRNQDSFTRVHKVPDTKRDPEWAGATRKDPKRFRARYGRTSLREFASIFLRYVESDDERADHRSWLNDERVPRIVAALEGLGLDAVDRILGSGSFGTAAFIEGDGHQIVVKLTSDASEVQAGYVLIDVELPHVAEVYLSSFIRGVRVVDRASEDGKSGSAPVGILYTEKVDELPYDHAAEELSNFVQSFKEEFKVWPHQLAALPEREERERLNRASKSLAILLHEQATDLRDHGSNSDADLCDDVASGVEELREHGVYGIDVHAGNVGFVRAHRLAAKTYKIFDIGSSSAPTRPQAPSIGGNAQVSAQAGFRTTIVSEDAPKPMWVGEGVDEAESVEDARIPRTGLQAGTPLAVGTVLYHGTNSPREFESGRGPMWLTDDLDLATNYARHAQPDEFTDPEREFGGQPRVLQFRLKATPKLLLLTDKNVDYRRMYRWLVGRTPPKRWRPGEPDIDDHELARRLCERRMDGWYGFGVLHIETMLCEPWRFLELTGAVPVVRPA